MRNFIASIPPFKGLPKPELDRLADLAKEKTFSRGETIFTEGESAGLVWILKEGRVQIVKYSSEGKPLTIEIIQPGELFGTLCRLGGAGRPYPCTAIAQTNCTAVWLTDQTFFQLMGTQPSVLAGVCSLCSQRLTEMQGMSCSSQEPVEQRIARMLLKLKDKHGTELPFTKKEIAEMVGTTVETTFRVLSNMREKGFVGSSRGVIQLKNIKKLEGIARAVPC